MLSIIKRILFGSGGSGGLQKGDPEKAKRVREAYRPVRDDSTFEFTIEHVVSLEGGAIACGLVTKGTLLEGYRLRLIPQSGDHRECVCNAIAGLTERVDEASADGPDKNIGIWLDLPPADIETHDRLISFDVPEAAKRMTPAEIQFSILHGVRK